MTPNPINAVAYFKAFAWSCLIAMGLFLIADFWILILLVVVLFVIFAIARMLR